MIKAVFFDLDGTLLDTLGDIHAHVNSMLRHFSLPELAIEETRAFVGDGAKKLIERALKGNKANLDECFAYFSEEFEEGEAEFTKLFCGEREVLGELKSRGLHLCVITNKPQIAAEKSIAKFFDEGYFDFVGGDSGMFPLKPDPSLARYMALKMRLSAQEVVIVGDGEADIVTSQNARMRCISALWGYRTREQLEKVGAKEFAENFKALSEMI